MLFNPVANLGGAHDLRIIAGDAAVGQAFCDPLTFGGPRFDARVRELLRLVWPSTPAQARLMWGGRIAARARQHPVDELVAEAVADVMGVPAAVLRAIESQWRAAALSTTLPTATSAASGPSPASTSASTSFSASTSASAPGSGFAPASVSTSASAPGSGFAPASVSASTSGSAPGSGFAPASVSASTSGFAPAPEHALATLPMELLRAAVARAVRDRGVARPETVLDELLFWRGLGPERVSLDDVAELVTALTAALWDAASMLLPALLDAALTHPAADRASLVERVLSDGPGVIGWLRESTQAVLLDGDLIPAGERCLLLVEAVEPAGRRAREPLRTLRWLAPESPSGAGATFARLVGNALPVLPTELPGVPPLEELRTAPPRRLQLLLQAADQSGTTSAPAKASGRFQTRRSRRV
ncbi:hypothetical protein ABT369_03690 [Dactylosporangium sp. NPDC000244]|uniref:hypothetical protein n=1 Tax=Dactylosporangium sp. NPDC000244 TaxID=3154365 RepID=UPI003330D12A